MSKENQPKIGAGTVMGMVRQGIRELRGALYPESNVAQPTDYGIWGNETPGEVAQARREGVEQDSRGTGWWSALSQRVQSFLQRFQSADYGVHGRTTPDKEAPSPRDEMTPDLENERTTAGSSTLDQRLARSAEREQSLEPPRDQERDR